MKNKSIVEKAFQELNDWREKNGLYIIGLPLEVINKYEKIENKSLVEKAFKELNEWREKNEFPIIEIPQEVLEKAKEIEQEQSKVTENTSDGYHTFKELYEFRKAYNVALFNEWAKQTYKYNVHKSWKHYEGDLCFGGGWFIVVAILPEGQISNHYKAEDWDLFNIPSTPKALFPFDGHTGQDVIERLLKRK
jgi:hypothetical protein